MRAEHHRLVYTLWKSCICFQVGGNVFARPLVVGMTLLSSEALGAAPGLGAGNAQLLLNNLWHHRGPRRSPFSFRVQDSWKVTPSWSGAGLGLLLHGRQGTGTRPFWHGLSEWLRSHILGSTCEMLLLQMKRDHGDQTEACVGRGLPASSGSARAL